MTGGMVLALKWALSIRQPDHVGQRPCSFRAAFIPPVGLGVCRDVPYFLVIIMLPMMISGTIDADDIQRHR